MGNAFSFRIADNLYLVRQEISKGAAPAKPVETPTNHIAVIDCSGSMYSELPKIRKQLKEKLPKLLKADDTISIVWFSGRGQFGTLVEGEKVASLGDLAEVNKAIDRWLVTVGLTGFKEPIEEAAKVVERVGKKHKNPFALFFMSDGCDNQWNRADILKAVEKAAGGLSSAAFVEYGYYADRPLLTAMAEKAGGSLIFAEDFDKYEPMFAAAMQKKVIGGKRVEIAIKGDPIGGIVFAMDAGDLLTYEASSGKASVAEHLDEVTYLSPTSIGKGIGDLVDHTGDKVLSKNPHLAGAYAAVSLFATRMKPEIVYPILKGLGDVAFIEKFSGCFGKQKYSEFMDAAKTAVFDPGQRWAKGWDPTKVPADDAFTVLDLLNVLAGDDDTRVLLDHQAFKYSRISRGRVDSDDNLTDEERTQIAELTAKIAKAKSAKAVKDLQVQIDQIMALKPAALKFVADPQPEGYPISSLTYNEERPNISILVRKTGTVDLTERRPLGKDRPELAKIPTTFPTFIYRNYAITRDGLVNVERLPVRISLATYQKLEKNGVEMVQDPATLAASGTPSPRDGGLIEVVINVKPLPIINRNMVKAASAKKLFELEWDLTKARAAQKVYNTFKKEKFPKESKGYKLVYGDAAAEWLKEQGITDFNGFSPKMVQAESTDFILGKQMEVKIKGYSSLPSVKDVKGKAGKKLTGGAALMNPSIEECEKFFAGNPEKTHEKWIDGKQSTMTATTRGLLFQKAQMLFTIIVGQVWFTEFKSIDENTMTIKADGEDLACTVEMKEIEIKI